MVGGDKLEEGPILLLHSVETGEQKLTSNPAGSGNPSWSKDGRWILYAQVDTAGSDLMLPENFR